MARDEREEEREFLADLKARTGRDLADWMAAITAQGLRRQERDHRLAARAGLSVRARVLARAHPQQRRPADLRARSRPRARSVPRPRRAAAASRRSRAPKPPVQKPLSTRRGAPSTRSCWRPAKGYRPLYLMLEAEMRKALPGARDHCRRPSYISIGAPAGVRCRRRCTPPRCASGSISATGPFDPHLQKSKLKGPPARPSPTWSC